MIQLVTIIGVLNKCYRHLLVDNCNHKLEKNLNNKFSTYFMQKSEISVD